MCAQPSPQSAYLQKSPAPPALAPHLSGLPPVCTALPLPDIAGKRDETGPGPVGLALVTERRLTRVHRSGVGAPSLFMGDTLLCGRPTFSLFARQGLSGSFPLWGCCEGCCCTHCLMRFFMWMCGGASLLLSMLTRRGYLLLKAEHLGSRGPWTRAHPWRWGSDLVTSLAPAPAEAQPRDRTNGDFWNI